MVLPERGESVSILRRTMIREVITRWGTDEWSQQASQRRDEGPEYTQDRVIALNHVDKCHRSWHWLKLGPQIDYCLGTTNEHRAHLIGSVFAWLLLLAARFTGPTQQGGLVQGSPTTGPVTICLKLFLFQILQQILIKQYPRNHLKQ